MHTQRTIGLIELAIVVALAAATAGLVWWFGPALGLGVAAGAALSVVFLHVAVIGPWQRRWGATREEVLAMMPCDEPLPPGKMLRTIERRVGSAASLGVAS